MDIFPGKFYEPSEEETKLEEFKQSLIEKNKKMKYIQKYLEVDFSKINYLSYNPNEES